MAGAGRFPGPEEVGGACSIAVLYQDEFSRNRVVNLLEQLRIGFKGQMTFHSSWWGFRYLQHAGISEEAAEAAVNADVILVSVPSRQVPGDVKAWLEHCLSRRGPHRAAALGLLEVPTGTDGPPSEESGYFQQLAHRAGLEYLSLDQEPALQGSRGAKARSGWEEDSEEDLPSSGWGIND